MIAIWVTWLLAIYGLSAILVYLMKRWNEFYLKVREIRIHLLVHNSESSIERTVRSLVNLSRLEGRPIHLTIYDFGSTDHTRKIIERLHMRNPYLFEKITVVSSETNSFTLITPEELQKAVTTIDLRGGKPPKIA